jgi:hypothetical protein
MINSTSPRRSGSAALEQYIKITGGAAAHHIKSYTLFIIRSVAQAKSRQPENIWSKIYIKSPSVLCISVLANIISPHTDAGRAAANIPSAALPVSVGGLSLSHFSIILKPAAGIIIFITIPTAANNMFFKQISKA